jgi:hypothetical protein
MEKETTIEIAVRSDDFSVYDKYFVRLLVFRLVESQFSSVKMRILKMKNSVWFSFIHNVLISEHFHAITIFKLVGLWIEFFVKLFFV